MKAMRRIPDAEFQVMKAVWQYDGPVCGANVMEKLAPKKEWKIQTILTLMNRLVEKGYLTSEKTGKIRWYTPQITEEEYLDFATQTFVASHHEGSIASLV